MQNEPSLEEASICTRLLKSGERMDGRGLLEARNLTLRARENGSVEVLLGQTHLFVDINSAVIEPSSHKLGEGMLTIKVDFGLPSHVLVGNKRARQLSNEIVSVLEKTLKGSKALDTESLVIKTGKFVWAISLDIIVVFNDGNLVDAANFGALAALITHKHSAAMVEGNSVTLTDSVLKKFSLNHLPLVLTFAVMSPNTVNLPSTSSDEQAEFIVYDPNVVLAAHGGERMRGPSLHRDELLQRRVHGV